MNDIELQGNKGEIVMYQPDETIRLEVRMGEETVWLTQQQMAELFQTDRTSIGKHITNIFETEELEKEPTCAKIAQVRMEGNRQVRRSLIYYNLDMILSVGYRVNSKRGTKFRQWANKVLKEYLLRGYVVNTRIAALEKHAAEHDAQIMELKNKVDFFVRSSLPPIEGLFYNGQIFDAYAHIVSLIKQAKKSVVLIDNYINADTLTMLSNRADGVSATLYTRQLNQQQLLDVQRHNQQYPAIIVNTCRYNHDRFLIIDDDVYLFGASLKDAGKKLFAYIKMQETSVAEILSLIH